MVVNGTNSCQETFSSSEKLWEAFGRGPSGPRAGRSSGDRSELRGVQENQDLSTHLQRLWHHFAAGRKPVAHYEDAISGTRLLKQATSLTSALQPTWWRLILHVVVHSSAVASQGTSNPVPWAALPRGTWIQSGSLSCSKTRSEGP